MSAWTAEIIDLRPTATGVEVVTVMTDGVSEKFQQCFQTDGTRDSLVPQIRAALAAKDVATTKSDLARGQVLDLTPPVPIEPPTPDPDAVQFADDLATLQREVRARAGGLTTGEDVDALRARVQKTLDAHPEFGRVI